MKKMWVVRLLIAGLFLAFLSINAFAESTKIGELLDDDSGDVFELFQEDDGSFLVWVHHKDGTFSYFNIGTESNPDPDDPHGVGGKPDIKELARRYYKGELDKGVQTNNPFALKQSGQGKGLAPIWNPPDTVRDAGGAGGGTGGEPRDAAWIKDQARRGTGGEDDDDKEGTGSKKDRPGIGETGSVQPERVNPVPILNTPKSEVMSTENWHPPVDSGMAGQAGAPPVETPTQTLATTPGKAAGQVSAPGTVPAQEISSGGSEGRQSTPPISPAAPKVLPSGGIQRIHK